MEEAYIITYKYRKITRKYTKKQKEEETVKMQKGKEARKEVKTTELNKSSTNMKEDKEKKDTCDKKQGMNNKDKKLSVRSWDCFFLNNQSKLEYIKVQNEDIIALQEIWQLNHRDIEENWT